MPLRPPATLSLAQNPSEPWVFPNTPSIVSLCLAWLVLVHSDNDPFGSEPQIAAKPWSHEPCWAMLYWWHFGDCDQNLRITQRCWSASVSSVPTALRRPKIWLPSSPASFWLLQVFYRGQLLAPRGCHVTSPQMIDPRHCRRCLLFHEHPC